MKLEILKIHSLLSIWFSRNISYSSSYFDDYHKFDLPSCPWNLKLIFSKLNQYSNDHCQLKKKKQNAEIAGGLLWFK